ncbi:MAG: recombinase family protein, partial [Thermoplasmatota archaeon]
MKNVALYARVSTEDQALKGFSLEGQLEKLRSYCDARDWGIAGEYVDNGYSGRDTNRPAYQEMLGEIDAWDALLVMKMDRVHRNSKNFMVMMETLREHDKEFVSMTESLDTSTAMGRFVMDIIQRIAQLESEQIGERVYFGMRQKAKGGTGLLGSPAPYGYGYDDGRLAGIDEELDVVGQLYERYLDGDSLGGLAEWLEKRGIATKKQAKWDKKTISRILSNPVYCGLLEWEDILVPGEHRQVVSRETFNA